MPSLVRYLLWFSAISCGLLAGVYFAFSTFIMPAFGRIGPVHGALAMNSINSTILQSLFMPFFFGTTLVSLVLVAFALFHRSAPGATAMLVGGLIYIVGMFLCTAFVHVPLNNALAAVDPASSSATSVWENYLKNWTLWNHVRTIASSIASALYMMAIAAK